MNTHSFEFVRGTNDVFHAKQAMYFGGVANCRRADQLRLFHRGRIFGRGSPPLAGPELAQRKQFHLHLIGLLSQFLTALEDCDAVLGHLIVHTSRRFVRPLGNQQLRQ